MNSSCYRRSPLTMIDGIPVFAEMDYYVQNYDDIARDHLAHVSATGTSPFMTSQQIDSSLEVTLEALRKHVHAGQKLLDAGVGTGNLLAEALEYDRYGVDIAIDYLRLAARLGINVALAKLADLPYQSAHFDAVLVCDVLEHVLDLDATVSELKRVLKPGGILIVRVPNEEDLTSYVAAERYSLAHVRTFSAASLQLYFEKCMGATLLEARYTVPSFSTNSQLRYPAASRQSPARETLERLINSCPGQPDNRQSALEVLKTSMSGSLEEQVDALISLRDEFPETFAELAMHLLRPAELLGVFRIN